jgi:hypothetical protein
MRDTDPSSIESIQSRAPALSASDFEFIQEGMGSGKLLPGITDPGRRSDIKVRLLATEEPIPSLWTLISNIRYLKQPVKLLNTLLPPKTRKGRLGRNNSLRERFRSQWNGAAGDSIEVQQSASSFTTISRNNLDSFDVSYQQLWLCSYRVWSSFNAYGSTQLATLAFRLGFSTTQIKQALKKDPDHGMIENATINALKVLRPNERFSFDANQARSVISSFKDYLSTVLGTPSTTASPSITVPGPGEPLARRCGNGPSDTEDLNHLFLETIHAPLQEYHRGGDEISSFYVKRSRHIAFFGPLNLAAAQWDQTSSLYTAREPPTQTSSLYTAREHITAEDVYFDAESFYRNYEESVAANSTVQASERASGVVADPGGGASNHGGESGRVITFMEDGVTIQRVAYEREKINQQAQEYARQGKKLQVRAGGYVVWEHCFDALEHTRDSTVLLFPASASDLGQRR